MRIVGRPADPTGGEVGGKKLCARINSRTEGRTKTPRLLTSGNSAVLSPEICTASSVRPEARLISCHTGLPLFPPNVSFSYSRSPSGVTRVARFVSIY